MTTYRAKVTVINLGNAPAPEFQAWGTAVNSFPGPTGWPEMVPMRDIPPLAPGEAFVFRPGADQASFTNTWVKIYLDINHHIDELDETNNPVDKKLQGATPPLTAGPPRIQAGSAQLSLAAAFLPRMQTDGSSEGCFGSRATKRSIHTG